MPKLDLPPDIRNDSSLTLAEAEAKLANGIEITYGDMMLLVEPRALEGARAAAAALPVDDRETVMASVDRALRRADGRS